MGLPTLIKTWDFSVNHLDGTSTRFTGHGTTMFALKTALTTLGSNPWTVVSSSDGLANAGAADYWTDASKCNTHNTSGNRSWIVLQQSALGSSSTFQMMFTCAKNGGGQSTIIETYFSEGGLFTGGSLTANPTATDQVLAAPYTGAQGWWDHLDCTSTPARLHVAMSDDGEITRWWIYMAGYCPCFFSVEKPKDAVSGWTPPWFAVACVDLYSGTSNRPTYAYLNDIKTNTACRLNSTKDQLYLTSEGCVTSMLGQLQTWTNDLDSSTWPMFPIGLFSDTPASRGRHGTMTDIWWGSTTRAEGDHYPADTTRQFVQVGDLVLPWLGDGTIMQTS